MFLHNPPDNQPDTTTRLTLCLENATLIQTSSTHLIVGILPTHFQKLHQNGLHLTTNSVLFDSDNVIHVSSFSLSGSAAAKAGIVSGSGILKVGDTDVLKSTHNAVVNAVKSSLASTEGGGKVVLKLSAGNLEQVASYQYSTTEDTPVYLYDRTKESPYCFQLPAKVSEILW